MPAVTFLASIPSPSSGTLEIGPLTIHMYGLMLLAGIAACVLITGLPVGRPRRRLGSHLPRRGLGRRGRHRRSAALPPRYELERGPGRVVGAVRRLGGRPRHLGRDCRRRPRRRPGRAPVGSERPGPPRRCGARPPRRSGDRPRRQLVEPGALRQADGRRVGARDRLGSAPGRVHLRRDLPPDVPLRGALESRRRGASAPARPPHPLPAARALRALHRPLHGLPFLPREPAHRPFQGVARPARERVGRGRALRRVGALLRLVAVPTGPPRPRARTRPRQSRRRRWPSRGGASDPVASLAV